MKNLKSQKGSITLYTLISMIFFLIVTMTVYVNSSHRVSAQESQVRKIQNTYLEKDIDEYYEEHTQSAE